MCGSPVKSRGGGGGSSSLWFWAAWVLGPFGGAGLRRKGLGSLGHRFCWLGLGLRISSFGPRRLVRAWRAQWAGGEHDPVFWGLGAWDLGVTG